MYIADASVNRSAAELALKNSDNIITQNKYAADIGIQNAQIALESLKASYTTNLEAIKASGSIYSQLGASALSAINVSSSVEGRASLNANEDHRYDDK